MLAKVHSLVLLGKMLLLVAAGNPGECGEDVGYDCTRIREDGNRETSFDETADKLKPLLRAAKSEHPGCDSLETSNWHGGVVSPEADITVRGWVTLDSAHLNVCSYSADPGTGWTCSCQNADQGITKGCAENIGLFCGPAENGDTVTSYSLNNAQIRQNIGQAQAWQAPGQCKQPSDEFQPRKWTYNTLTMIGWVDSGWNYVICSASESRAEYLCDCDT